MHDDSEGLVYESLGLRAVQMRRSRFPFRRLMRSSARSRPLVSRMSAQARATHKAILQGPLNFQLQLPYDSEARARLY